MIFHESIDAFSGEVRLIAVEYEEYVDTQTCKICGSEFRTRYYRDKNGHVKTDLTRPVLSLSVDMPPCEKCYAYAFTLNEMWKDKINEKS